MASKSQENAASVEEEAIVPQNELMDVDEDDDGLGLVFLSDSDEEVSEGSIIKKGKMVHAVYARTRLRRRRERAEKQVAGVEKSTKENTPLLIKDNNHLEETMSEKQPDIPVSTGQAAVEETNVVKDAEETISKKCSEDERVVKFLGSQCKLDECKILLTPPVTVDNGRFKVISRVGAGAYGNVYEVQDLHRRGKLGALKVIRTDVMQSNELNSDSIDRELNMLRFIYESKPPPAAKSAIVKLHRMFNTFNHKCFLFEFLGPTVTQVLKGKGFKNFSLKEVRYISYQVCVAVNYMHSIDLIHHDIKPENILFASPSYEHGSNMEPVIKLIDFGSAIFSGYQGGTIGTTVKYRSPEMALKGKSTHFSDVWSIGCTMFELYSGFPLFDTTDETEKLYMIEAIFCTTIPWQYAKNINVKCFDEGNGRLKYDDENWIRKIHQKVKPFEEYNQHPMLSNVKKLFDLLLSMLKVGSWERIDTYNILHHPFFKNDLRCQVYDPMKPLTANNVERYVNGNEGRKRNISYRLKDTADVIDLATD